MPDSKANKGRRFIHAASLRQFGEFLFVRPCTVIIFAALVYTISVKFFHACRLDLTGEFFHWILDDLAVLLTIELLLSGLCFRFLSKAVVRIAVFIAAIVCTWSVMNAGWIIRTGTQILPSVLVQLFRTPVNSLAIVLVNLAKMPLAAGALLIPAAVLFSFFIFALVKAPLPNRDRRLFIRKTRILACVIAVSFAARFITLHARTPVVSEGLSFNTHIRVFTSLLGKSGRIPRKARSAPPTRKIPFYDKLDIKPLPNRPPENPNIVIVILEGIQYRSTSLADTRSDLTAFLAAVAAEGAEFVNTRCTVTHTTKALFAVLTGRFPSVTQDFIEAAPAPRPYASLATILRQNLGYRTAFFQSAKGNFESRPGLVYNLGFEKFFAREDLNDSNAYLGYLAADEFKMLEPITQWIKADRSPFLLTVLCTVTHDPYEVPEWFAEPAQTPFERYRQSVRYTDDFLRAVDAELTKLSLTDNTIFCIIGDHGEAFAEHGLFGHERIIFDEVLRVPFVIRANRLIEPSTKIHIPLSSIDLTPTLLALLNFDVNSAAFDGINAFAPQPPDRNVYFSTWLQPGGAGFIKDGKKFVYDTQNKSQIARDIITWRKNTAFHPHPQSPTRKIIFENWLCQWNNRTPSAKYITPKTD